MKACNTRWRAWVGVRRTQVVIGATAMAIAIFGIGAAAVHAAGSFGATGAMNEGRVYHTATLLPDGRVLVTGGNGDTSTTIMCSDPNGNPVELDSNAKSTVELYDPATGAWTPASSMSALRQFHTATSLRSGKILVAGGTDNSCWLDASTRTAEVYDPVSGVWTPTGAMASHVAHSATLLLNGKVLVAGGYNAATLEPWARSDLYDPENNTWSQTGTMHTQRVLHAAALLQDGRVLVAGGNDGINGSVASAEIYDPATGSWTTTAPSNYPIGGGTAASMPNGEVLVSGGVDLRTSSLPNTPLCQ